MQMLSIPRVLSWDAGFSRLVANPMRELEGLRNGTLLKLQNFSLDPGVEHVLGLPSGTGAAMDLIVAFVVPQLAPASPQQHHYGVRVFAPDGPLLNISVTSVRTSEGSVRTVNIGGTCGHGRRDTGEKPSCSFVLLPDETVLEVRVLVDRSSAEFFVGGGRAVRTFRFYPRSGVSGAAIVASKSTVARSVAAYEMGCGWQ